MDQNLGLIWERCLKFMRDNLSASEHEDVKKLEHSFDLLFDRVQPMSLINHNLTLLVPSDFYKEYIEENSWLKSFMKEGTTYLVRPDRYIFGSTTSDVSLEELINDLKIRINL